MKDQGAGGDSAAGLLLTLTRGIQVLEQIAHDQGRATAKSLCADLELNLGTCYQLLRTLQAHGYVYRLRGGRYGLGTRVGFLADHYEDAVAPPPELMDLLHELRDEVQETVYITVRRHREVPVAAVLEGTQMLRVGSLTVGYTKHPHIRASSRALLAYVDEDTLEDFVESNDFEALTPNTVTTWGALLDELAATRTRGYGRDVEEYVEGVSCLGSVILDEDGQPFGAYGSSMPSRRLSEDEELIAQALMHTAEKASRFLGYEGPYPPSEDDQ